MATRVLVDTTSTQTISGKTLTAPTITAGVVALAAAPTATLDAATKGYVDAQNINPINNGSLAASVSSNILTISLRTAGGSTPSASDPVRVTFRNSTDADGSVVTRTVSSATSMTFASGSTLGTQNGIAARIWCGLIDNAGTVEICAWNPLSTALSLKAFTSDADVSTTAEGSGTATSTQVLYSTNARSTVPFVLLGYLEITDATAGAWATAPTVVQTYREGMRRTGDVIQTAYIADATEVSTTTAIPADDTVPDVTADSLSEYTQVALTLTPMSATNLLSIQAVAGISLGTASNINMLVMIVKSGTAAVKKTFVAANYAATGMLQTVVATHRELAGSASSQTWKIYYGPGAAATMYINNASGTSRYGGTQQSIHQVVELMV